MDFAFGDKLAKNHNGLKFPTVHQGLFHGTVDGKRTKTEDSKETKSFSTMITETNRPKKLRVDSVIEIAGKLEKSYENEGIQIYSAISETKAAFAESTFWSKNIFLTVSRGIHWSLAQFWIPEGNVWLLRKQKNVRSSFFDPFFTANLYESIEKKWKRRMSSRLKVWLAIPKKMYVISYARIV